MNEFTLEDTQKLLAPYRARLDEIDRQLLELLRDRMRVIEEVAELKKRHTIAVMQHGRVAQIHEKIRAYAGANGVSADYLTSLYDTIISEACRIEELVMDRRGQEQ